MCGTGSWSDWNFVTVALTYLSWQVKFPLGPMPVLMICWIAWPFALLRREQKFISTFFLVYFFFSKGKRVWLICTLHIFMNSLTVESVCYGTACVNRFRVNSKKYKSQCLSIFSHIVCETNRVKLKCPGTLWTHNSARLHFANEPYNHESDCLDRVEIIRVVSRIACGMRLSFDSENMCQGLEDDTFSRFVYDGVETLISDWVSKLMDGKVGRSNCILTLTLIYI